MRVQLNTYCAAGLVWGSRLTPLHMDKPHYEKKPLVLDSKSLFSIFAARHVHP